MSENKIFGCGVDKLIEFDTIDTIGDSQGLITVKLSDLSFIEQNKFCYLFKKVKDPKTGQLNYILDKNKENGQEIKLEDGASEPALNCVLKRGKMNIEEQNTLVVPCGDVGENIYGFRFCFAKKKLEESELQKLQELKGELQRDDLVWLELKSNSANSD